MSFLSNIQSYSQAKLRPTATRVTNSLGQISYESKADDGSFKVSHTPTDASSDGIFMIVNNSPDQAVHYVIDGVYIGSQDAAVNLSGLTACQITHVLNVATGIRNAFPKLFTYLNVELLDVPEANIRSVFPLTNEFIKKTIDNGGRILVHCNAGISRSASIVLAYLIGILHMPYDDAYNLLKSARSRIKPNNGFVQQLKEFANETIRINKTTICDE